MSSVILILEAAIPKKTNILHNLSNVSSKEGRLSVRATTRGMQARNSLQSGEHIQIGRRSGGYLPTLWDSDFIQSLNNMEYTEEREYSTRAAELIEKVKTMLLQQEMDPIPRLELIDDLQRLGISYHFDDEINQILNSTCINYCDYHNKEEKGLYSTALAFRLLREHGFRVSQDVFDCFKNEKGNFRSSLGDDTRGLLQLYEASFLLTEGEESLEAAKHFATKFLQRKLDDEGDDDDDYLIACVSHALELPIHWRIQRPNTRWFIEAYERRKLPQMINPSHVVELAVLDFNILQSMHQQELKLVSTWWKQTRLSEKLPFARDRVVECYLWAVGVLSPPRYRDARMMATKVNLLITMLDDIFDIYATLEELHLFNHTIQRWDLEVVDQLPKYMQIFFISLNNLIDEMAYDVLKEQDILIIQHLRKSWKDLCTSFLQEAEWHAAGHTPTLDEYINNGWISSSGHVILSHAFFLITNPIHESAVESLYKYHDLVRFPAMLFRLTNDLATFQNEMERGDVAESVQCYMKESGTSVEEAREHVKLMIWETWKKMNQEIVIGDSQFSHNFIASAVDLGRMAQYVYQIGDGHGIQNPQIKDRISSLLFQPIV